MVNRLTVKTLLRSTLLVLAVLAVAPLTIARVGRLAGGGDRVREP